MRVLVCGGRNYTDVTFLYKYLNKFVKEHISQNEHIVVISGLARGADSIAQQWAKDNEYDFEGYAAHWKQDGKSAGYLRNVEMLEKGKPDYIVAFPGGKGTQMMIDLATEAGVPVYLAGQ